eukprot:m.369509 g.369509  ORF g.369509 m.369509 type:complete len:520 (-) comp20851_c0_seq7:2048-3607(-)
MKSVWSQRGVRVLALVCMGTVCAAQPSQPPQVCALFGADGKKICADELYFEQHLDHFRFDSNAIKTWKHRFLVNDDHWGKGTSPLKVPAGCPGPILMYTGNEGPIDAFWGSNGFMVNHLAPLWGALLLFPEERYYGKSTPFGPQSLTAENAVYLTTEQVLADYATLLTWYKDTHNATSCPVVAFGGSYGGTLTTYFRRMYPTLTVGGLAASAPIGYYSNSGWAAHNVNAYTWIDIVQKVFSSTQYGGEACFNRLKATVEAVETAGATAQGRDMLAKRMHLCDVSVLGADPTNFLIDALETLPQEDYPYAIGSLPAWPVNATCRIAADAFAAAVDDTDLIGLAANITDMFYGYTAGGACLQGEGQGGIPGGGPGPAEWGPWGVQSCTETLHQFSSSKSGHGFRDFQFNMDEVVTACATYYALKPNPPWAEMHWGGYGIGDGNAGVTHLIWSNGLLDPWHGGGFLRPFSNNDELHWFIMPQGAHHLDLRGPHPQDPPNVTATRAAEQAILARWIEEASQDA